MLTAVIVEFAPLYAEKHGCTFETATIEITKVAHKRAFKELGHSDEEIANMFDALMLRYFSE